MDKFKIFAVVSKGVNGRTDKIQECVLVRRLFYADGRTTTKKSGQTCRQKNWTFVCPDCYFDVPVFPNQGKIGEKSFSSLFACPRLKKNKMMKKKEKIGIFNPHFPKASPFDLMESFKA